MWQILDVIFSLWIGTGEISKDLEIPERRERTVFALVILGIVIVICIGVIIYASSIHQP